MDRGRFSDRFMGGGVLPLTFGPWEPGGVPKEEPTGLKGWIQIRKGQATGAVISRLKTGPQASGQHEHRPVPSPLDSRPPRPRWASTDIAGHVVTFVVTFGQGGDLKTKKPRFLAVF